MMKYFLEVKNPCRCFIKEGGVEFQEFDSSKECEEEAEALLEHMEKTYCKKHQFRLAKGFAGCTIHITPRV